MLANSAITANISALQSDSTVSIDSILSAAMPEKWNLLGTPIDTTRTQLKSKGINAAVWWYDPSLSNYSTSDSVFAGNGFWYKSSAAAATTDGTSATTTTTTISDGYQQSLQESFVPQITANTSDGQLDSIASQIAQKSGVVSAVANYGSKSVDIEYSDGSLGSVGIKPSGDLKGIVATGMDSNMRALDNQPLKNNKVIAIGAQYWDWGANDDVPMIADKLELTKKFTVSRFYSRVDGSGSLNWFKNLNSYGIVLISTHGDSFKFKNGSEIVIVYPNVKADLASILQLKNDLIKRRLLLKTFPDGTEYVLTPSFISTYNSSFDDSLIYMSICRGSYNSTLGDSFVNSGAGAFFGYTDYVAVSFSKNVGTAFFDKLLSKDKDLTYNNVSQSYVKQSETDSDPATFEQNVNNPKLSILLSPPKNFKVVKGTTASEKLLSWDKVSGADYYKVYADGKFYSQTFDTKFTYSLTQTTSFAVSACMSNDICSDQTSGVYEVVTQCNGLAEAGGDAAERHTIDLGVAKGTFSFQYSTYSIKDQITVYYEGSALYTTGCVGSSGTKSISYSGKATTVTVDVTPNCSGGTSGTAWNFTVACPK